MNQSRPRVLYIIGDARSGSTILDALLGSRPGIVATGELNMLFLDDFGAPRVCACTRPMEDCPLWGPVLRRWTAALAPHRPSDFLGLQKRFERFRGLPRLFRHSRRRSSSFEDYTRWTVDLLNTIADVGSAAIVAESAKNPVRALAFLRGGGVEMTLVHLVRDPRGVAWSKRKLVRWRGLPIWLHNPVAVVLRAALDWTFANLFTEIVASRYRHVPYVRIRYEDLVRDPAGVLGRIGDVAGIDLSTLGERASAGEVFGFGHIMAGNIARERGPRPLVPDVDWRENAPRRIRWTVWLLTGWLARRYGYRRK